MGTELVHKLTHLHVTVRLGRQVTYIDGGSTVVQVFVDIRPATQNPNAPPLDLRLVIDRSSSMNGAKIMAVKHAMRELIGELNTKDRLALITFADFHVLDLSCSDMDDHGRQKALAVVEAIQAGGNTFISGGVEEAITRPDDRYETRLVLFTDGESTVNTPIDHAQLVRSADRARSYGLPMLIYGTGSDYNFALLQQLAVRAGNGSFLKHVMQADELLKHLRSEIGFLRGVGVRGLVVTGKVPNGTTIVRAASFMPQQRTLTVTPEGSFIDHSGALDRARGQQYFFEIEVNDPKPEPCEVMNLTLSGREAGTDDRFTSGIHVNATFTQNAADQSDPDPEVVKVALHMAAVAKADQGDYVGSSVIYARAGDHGTAKSMRDMADAQRRRTHGAADIYRGAHTMTHGSVNVAHTMLHPIRDTEEDS